MDLKFEIDAESIAKQFGDLSKQLESDLNKGVQSLAKMTNTKTQELVKDKFSGNSLEDIYIKNLSYEQIDETMSIVTLNKDALFIEEGRKAGFQDELLFGKSSKVSKKGKRYAVIPFKHSESTGGVDTTQTPVRQTTKSRELANEIKQALSDKGVDWKKIEYNPDGSPRTGRLHTFNLDSARLKSHHKTPAKAGVSVYQTKTPEGKVRRDVMTFRIIHEDHKDQGLWNHPGMKAEKFMDRALEWAERYWETDILPQILKKYE